MVENQQMVNWSCSNFAGETWTHQFGHIKTLYVVDQELHISAQTHFSIDWLTVFDS